jgi:hypothetical protein
MGEAQIGYGLQPLHRQVGLRSSKPLGERRRLTIPGSAGGFEIVAEPLILATEPIAFAC